MALKSFTVLPLSIVNAVRNCLDSVGGQPSILFGKNGGWWSIRPIVVVAAAAALATGVLYDNFHGKRGGYCSGTINAKKLMQ